MRATRRLLTFVGAGVVVLVVAEGVTRVLSPALPAPEEWGDEATAVKVAQMDALGCADVVFAGNSVARDDFDPDAFASDGGRSAYNAALDAASPAQLERWLPDEVVPRLDPSVVVWAITSPDLNDASPAGQAALRSYDESVGGREDLVGRLQRPLIEHVALARYRETLASPPALWRGIGDRLAGDDADRPSPAGIPDVLGPLGQGLSRRPLEYVPDDPVVTTFARDQLLADFHVGGEQLAAAHDLIADLDARGVDVVLVLPPVTDEFVGLHPQGEESFADYRAAVASLSSDTGAPVIDLTSYGDDSWFADTHHLNARGSDAITRILTTELEAAGLPAGADRCDGSGS